MKIIITTFTYFPNLDGVAEAARFVAELLTAAGHEVVVITSAGSEESVEFVHHGVRVIPYRLSNSHALSWSGRQDEVNRYRSRLLTEKPDLLICECWDAWPTVLALPLLSKLACPKILISHGFTTHLKPAIAPPPFYGVGQWFRSLLWTICYIPKMVGAFNRFVFLANRRDTGRFIDVSMMSLIRGDDVRILPNSPNIDFLPRSPEAFREMHGIGSGPMVLCIANYCTRKNQELAVKTFFEAGVPGSTLVCIGSEKNDYFDKVTAMVRDQQPAHPDQKILLLTGISREETMKAYAASNLFLLTALEETQPIVLIESMAFSKPWIATRSGCIREMEGGVCVGSHQELVLWLKKLMTDSAHAVRLGGEGRSAYERRYDRASVIARWVSLVNEVYHSIA